jgi:hypothetical protein
MTLDLIPKTIATIGTYNRMVKYYCFINHLNQIWVYQSGNFYLYSTKGDLVRTLITLKNDSSILEAICYNKQNFEVYLAVSNNLKKSISVFNKHFYLIKEIKNDLTNPDYPINCF